MMPISRTKRSNTKPLADSLQGPALADTTHVYIGSEMRLYDGLLLYVRGVSTSLSRMIAEDQRHRLARVSEMGSKNNWVPDDQYERIGIQSKIYEFPVGAMFIAGRVKPIYGPQKGGDWEYPSWGSLAERASGLKTVESRMRRQYRQEHRDGTDPLKEITEKAIAALPARATTTDEIFVVHRAGFWTRIGFFTTYEAALKAAPKGAEIIALPLDGHTPLDEGRTIRGWIAGGWGYASGYGPSTINSQNR